MQTQMRRICAGALVVGSVVGILGPDESFARVRLENICTIYGQKEIQLTGIGLVVGLDKTGDGGKNATSMRALAAVLKLMNSPVVNVKELKSADNVALVHISATIPSTGLRRGQKIDCYVSSMLGAKSLRGGRLLVSPVETADIGDDRMVGLASGPLSIEDDASLRTARIPMGIVLEDNFITRFVDKKRGHIITLLLDAAHSSFRAASEVADRINSELSPGNTNPLGENLRRFTIRNDQPAKAIGPGVIEVKLPPVYYNSPVEFVALVLEIGIDTPHTQARVVINAKTNTIVVTGEVEISPVVITHKSLTVEIGAADNEPQATGLRRFVPLYNKQNSQTPQQLQSLLQIFNELRVPPEDIIEIIRELHRTGKLHAAYEEH